MLGKIFLVFSLFLVTFLIVIPSPAHAQNWGGCVQNGVATLACIPVVFSNIVNGALLFVGSIAVIMLIYAGIRFVTSGGDPKQVSEAQKIITYAIFGLVLVLCSFGIIYTISYLTGAKCITTFSFTSCQ